MPLYILYYNKKAHVVTKTLNIPLPIIGIHYYWNTLLL